MLGAQDDTGTLEVVLVKHARDAFRDDAALDAQWRDLGYLGRPDLATAAAQSDALISLLEERGVEVRRIPADDRVGLDSIYVRDAAVTSARGVILARMGKAQRRTEPGVLGAVLEAQGIPVLGSIQGEGLLEGGDVVWLDERTVAVGRGYRTNDEGIRQLRELLGDSIDEMMVVPLPHHRGPGDVFHLMSMLSPLDRDLALVHSPLLPVPFREALLARSVALVEVPGEEFETMGCNVLALGPRCALMLAGNAGTRRRLEAAGVEVVVYDGSEISARGCGGPTCLTRPLRRGTVAR